MPVGIRGLMRIACLDDSSTFHPTGPPHAAPRSSRQMGRAVVGAPTGPNTELRSHSQQAGRREASKNGSSPFSRQELSLF